LSALKAVLVSQELLKLKFQKEEKAYRMEPIPSNVHCSTSI